MKLMRTAPKKDIVTWYCSCDPKAVDIPVSVDYCPHCGASMPQEVRTQIYLQVVREFRAEKRRRRRMMRRRFAGCLSMLLEKIWPYLLVLLALFVVISGVGWVIRQIPAVFEAIGDFFADIFDGPLEFIRDLLPEKSKDAVAAAPKEKDPFTFHKLFQGIKNFFGWIWDALVWIFNILKKLWQALVWVVKFIAGLAVMLVALIIELFKLLYKVIKFLLSLL